MGSKFPQIKPNDAVKHTQMPAPPPHRYETANQYKRRVGIIGEFPRGMPAKGLNK